MSKQVAWAMACLILTACGGTTTGGSSDAGSDGAAGGGGSAGSGGGAGSGGSSGSAGSGGTAGVGGSGGAGGVDWAACTGGGQCEVLATGCCGVCGQPHLPDVLGVNRSQESAYHTAQCPSPVGCPQCAGQPNPNLAARCDGAHCQAFDLTNDPWSASSTDADCQLRGGLACCESCQVGTYNLVAVARSAVGPIEMAMCGPTAQPCPSCPAPPPGVAVATCVAGHCAVQYPVGTGGAP